MSLSLLNIFKNFNNLRYSLGITMMFNGFPMIFFIRDTMRIGPAGSVFTVAFFTLAFLLMFPDKLFVRMYKPNIVLLNLGLGFLLVSVYYYFFINHGGRASADLGYFLFILGFILLLFHVPNDVKDTLILVLFFYSLFCNVTLVYSLITDPRWSIGMRAAVSFASDTERAEGNPHMTARNGVICLVSAMVLIPRFSGMLMKLFLFFSAIFSIGVVIISLAKSSYIGIGLMIFCYFVFRFRVWNAITSARRFFTFQNTVMAVLAFFAIQYFLSFYYNIFDMIMSYWNTFEDRIMNVIFTALGVKLSSTANIDYSAMGRVSGFDEFQQTLFSWDAFLGRGYKSVYLDIPLLESFVAEGIPGFLFFASFNFFMLIYSIREIRRGTNSLTTFLAYFFISMSILLLTGGQPTEIAFWFPYAVFMRFLGIKYLDKNPATSTGTVAVVQQ